MNAREYAVYVSQEYYGVCVKCVWSVSSCTASTIAAILPFFRYLPVLVGSLTKARVREG